MAQAKSLEAHLFICTNEREKGDACANCGTKKLRDELKAYAKDPQRDWKGRVRINAAGCLGRCEEGGVAVLYPQGKWFTHLTEDSAPLLIEALSEVLDRK